MRYELKVHISTWFLRSKFDNSQNIFFSDGVRDKKTHQAQLVTGKSMRWSLSWRWFAEIPTVAWHFVYGILLWKKIWKSCVFGMMFKGFKDRIYFDQEVQGCFKDVGILASCTQDHRKKCTHRIPAKKKSGSRSFEEIYQDHVGNKVTI